jgi:hypothetical protein
MIYSKAIIYFLTANDFDSCIYFESICLNLLYGKDFLMNFLMRPK